MLIKLEKGVNSNVGEAGGKGNSLLKLINAEYSVPCGFIIPSDYFINTLKTNNVYEIIIDICSHTTLDNFKENSVILKDIVIKCEVKFELAELAEKLNSLVSVRSSAISEDSANYSFAGLHDSFLNIEKNCIAENVKKVWASIFNDRAIFYCLYKKLPLFEGIAVIIQEMVQAKYSGVVFTTHPIETEFILVEVTSGTGDSLVDGRITPDRFLFDRKTLEISKSEISSHTLIDEQELRNLVNKSMEIERLFGRPQDIEWAISDKLYFLQSRAVVI